MGSSIGFQQANLIFSPIRDDDDDNKGCWAYVGSQRAQGGKEGQTVNL